jgi:hypothetical protein
VIVENCLPLMFELRPANLNPSCAFPNLIDLLYISDLITYSMQNCLIKSEQLQISIQIEDLTPVLGDHHIILQDPEPEPPVLLQAEHLSLILGPLLHVIAEHHPAAE